jgi:hypothetical protein
LRAVSDELLMHDGREHDDSGEHHKRVDCPFSWHSSAASGVTILMPPAITIAVPKTPHIRLPAVLVLGEIMTWAIWRQQIPDGRVSRPKDVTLNCQNESRAIVPGAVNKLLTVKRRNHPEVGRYLGVACRALEWLDI